MPKGRTKGAKNKPKVYIEVALADLNEIFKPEAMILVSGAYKDIIRAFRGKPGAKINLDNLAEKIKDLDNDEPGPSFEIVDLEKDLGT